MAPIQNVDEEAIPLVAVASGSATEEGIATTTIAVDGMTCGACTSAIEGGFTNVDGVVSFTVSLMTERAVVVHDLSKISAEQAAEIIEDRGFDAKIISTDVATPKRAKGPATTTAMTTVKVGGMTCGACTSAVEGGFSGVDGIISFTVSLMTERAVAVHDTKLVSAEKVVEIIEDCGFDAELVSSEIQEDEITNKKTDTAIFKIFGLTTAHDCNKLEDALLERKGVNSVMTTLSNARAKIDYTPSLVGLRDLVEIVETSGFNALLADVEENNAQLESLAKTKEIKSWKTAFQVSVVFAIPVFLISMIIPHYFPALDFGDLEILPGVFTGDVACLFLTIPVQFGVGMRFYKSAYISMSHRSYTMDVLVVLGTSTAFVFSVLAMTISALFMPHNRPSTVFDTSTMLITFITLGRFLENRAKGQTSKALSRLMSLAPSMATIYVDPSKAGLITDESYMPEEKMIPTELIQPYDVVILRPGDKIPADGIVITGESFIDESMVTGESMPIMKRKGDQLIGGTVNGAGRLDFRVTRAGKDTQLSQIVKLVQQAQTSRAPIQRMADIVAGYFVPFIAGLGLVTFIGWMILSHVLTNPPAVFHENVAGGKILVCLKLCIAVVSFACPCALGLATPTAIMVGTGVGAQNGILVKSGAALETATKITQVVLDKTGTLTKGKMAVAVHKRSNSWETTETRRKLWWLLVGAAEDGSEHPVAKAIVSFARESLGISPESSFDASVTDFKVIIGRGVSATVKPTMEGKEYKVIIGNAKFLGEDNVSVPESAQKGHSNGTHVFVSINGEYSGFTALSDELKADAAQAVAAFRRMGIKVAMVTGDHSSTALSVAKEVGIPPDCVYSSIPPSEKANIITRLQSSEIVAMVGDGINDSPALATANVGIAMSSGTDVAMEAADIVIMRPEHLMDVPASLHLSRTIFRRIKLNLWWACMYNAVGLPFAMGLFLPLGWHLPPMAAAVAMAMSSISVVMSSQALKWWKRPRWMESEERVAWRDGKTEWWRFWDRGAQQEVPRYERLLDVERGV
ncbi:E1-E2 ATPase-domain-containing protein [Pyronema domesticum]|uniref:P-type Cu(+) transporter n=1 Tax=Pyronema omphalodes (strain CBS 100304) TaxID=1076935 RepID=U4L3G9_PYROM|nr:E1-E2 ATPase-domain-containing protein [Pyronema domesticum]CCX10576.1 Similar to Copper-transporting ATPase ccc2; acc. no. O59666 [Pyronema omphalodes CBS 100304]